MLWDKDSHLSQLTTLKEDDVLAIVGGNLGTLLLFDIKEDHNGLRLADHLAGTGVDGALLEGETFRAETTAPGLHDDGFTIEDGGKEVGLNVGNDRHYGLQTEVGGKHLAKVFVLAKVVVGEIAIVVDVTVGIEVVETNLDVYLAIKDGINCLCFHNENQIQKKFCATTYYLLSMVRKVS